MGFLRNGLIFDIDTEDLSKLEGSNEGDRFLEFMKKEIEEY